MNIFKYASPASFYPLASKLIPIFWLAAILITGFGLYWGFFHTPDVLSDQKQYYRIIYPHVASAWMSMWLYVVMVVWALIGLVWRTRLSFMMAQATAPTGAIMTLIALLTGAFWGKTSWGTWWDWDPRMTSELILFFLYLGYMALHSAIEDSNKADRASALLSLVGLVMVPVIFWSVNCPDPNQCAALHQQSGMGRMDPDILKAMLITVLGFWCYCFAVILMRLKNIILVREANNQWVKNLPEVSK